MTRFRSILMLLQLTIATWVPTSWGMEVDLPELPRQDDVLQTTIKKVGKGLSSGGRLSHNTIVKQFTTSVVRANGKLGARTLGEPVRVKVSISGKPVVAPRKLNIEPVFEAKISRTVSRRIPGDVEMSITSRPQNDNSLFVIYRFSF